MTSDQNRTIYFKLLAAQTGSCGPARLPDRPQADKMEERNRKGTPLIIKLPGQHSPHANRLLPHVPFFLTEQEQLGFNGPFAG